MTIQLSREKHKCRGFKSRINPKRKIFPLTCNPSKGKSHTREKLIGSAKWPPTAEVGQMSLYFYTISAKRGLPFHGMAAHFACTKNCISCQLLQSSERYTSLLLGFLFPRAEVRTISKVIKCGQKLNPPK
uniref:(northern house mosquito) hypothetical protein n=1 Tax=Culex pipiens TaxID=7175 RepID=A0A8D8FQW1_CULPI